jgi:hypothetical protein
MVMLFTCAGLIVFFVNNIIAVNSLAVDNNNIQMELNRTAAINNTMQTEIERLSSYDNIKPAALDRLGLKFSSAKPKKIVIDKSEIENLPQ